MLSLSLFIGQAFLYNAVFFTYALVLTKLLGVPADVAPWSLVPIALGNFLGPIALGRLFDSVGRKVMISVSYIGSGVLLVGTATLFSAGALDAFWLTICWMIVFFFASAGASAAYLTASEIFPMETRAMAIAFFYAVGTGIGGIIGPILFGQLISGGIQAVAVGYYIGAGLMIAAGLVEVVARCRCGAQDARGHRHAAVGIERRRHGRRPLSRDPSTGLTAVRASADELDQGALGGASPADVDDLAGPVAVEDARVDVAVAGDRGRVAEGVGGLGDG